MIIFNPRKKKLDIPCGLGHSFCQEDVSINYQNKTVDSSTVLQHVTYDPEFNALGYVDVLPYEAPSGNIVISDLERTDVTVYATAQVDPANIEPENIRKDVEILGVRGIYEPEIPELQEKTVDSSTESQTVFPDAEYQGLSKVTVSPYTVEHRNLTFTENGSYVVRPQEADAISLVDISVNVDSRLPEQQKIVDSSTRLQTVTPDAGYTLNKVQINPYSLGPVIVNSSTNQQKVLPPAGYDGLSEVTIRPYILETKSDTITSNGSYRYLSDKDGLSRVTIDVSVDTRLPEQSKSADSSTVMQTVIPDEGYVLSQVAVNPYVLDQKSDTITENGTYEYTSDADGLSRVSIDVSVDTRLPEQQKTIDSSNISQTVLPDQGYVLSQVTVNPYDPSTVLGELTDDATATEEEIFLGKTAYAQGEKLTGEFDYDRVNDDIDDILGDYTESFQSKTIDSSTSLQAVYADAGYLGLSQVVVNPYVLDTKTATILSNGTYEYTSDEDGLSRVTIDVSVASGKPEQTKVVNSSTVMQTVLPDQGYVLSQVTVNPYNPSTVLRELTDDATATEEEIFLGKTAYVQGEKLTGEFDYDGVDDLIDSLLGESSANYQSKAVDASTSAQIVSADAGYLGLSQVTVNPVTSEIDSNILAGNIRQGVSILGVAGTYEGEDWVIRAKKGELTDLSGYSLGMLPGNDFGCYGMFSGASTITKAPQIDPSLNSIGKNGFQDAFYKCASLTTAPDLSNIISVTAESFFKTFYNCTSLRSVNLSSVTSFQSPLTSCFEYTFFGCSSLNEIWVGFPTWPTGIRATYGWVYGVSQTGTFHCPPGLEEIFDENHIPVGWTVLHDVV